jgi:hypothetical protein
MSDKKYVYVAGKMTATGDIGPSEAHIQFLSNLARGIEFSGEVIVSGYHVFSPFIDYSIFLLLRPGLYISPKMIRANSMAWLEKCDQIILVPGDAWRDSQGTADELKRAGELHLPVYYTLDEMLKADEPHVHKPALYYQKPYGEHGSLVRYECDECHSHTLWYIDSNEAWASWLAGGFFKKGARK